MKETLRRAVRTFLQAAAGYVAAHAVVAAGGIAEGRESLRSVFITLFAASVACGIAAVMNLPGKTDNHDIGNGEDDGD